MPPGPRLLAVALVAAGLAGTLTSCGSVLAATVPTTSSSEATTNAATATPLGVVPTPSPTSPPRVRAGDWAIGDSVMLGSKPLLNAAGVRVDAVVSRQFGQAVTRLRTVRRAGHLPRNVVVHLGTNGLVTLTDCKEIIDASGRNRRVFLVTVRAPRSWVRTDNLRIRACAAAYPAGRVVLVDWHLASAHHPGWFYSDGIHPNAAGRRAYTRLITSALATRGL